MSQTIVDIFGAATQTLPGLLTILNVAILLFAVFFFTSTMASHLLEYFVGSINSRGRQLAERLATAMGGEAAKAVYANPLIASLCDQGRKGPQPPSYIEPDFLARAVVAEFANPTGPVHASAIVQQLNKEAGDDAAAF